jgi:hypothetical protein
VSGYPPNYFERCECGDTDAKHRHGLELGRAATEYEYSGAISVLRHAQEQGFPIHVATRSTCAEHIAEGDDKAESWALQPSLVLDVDRLARAILAGTDETGLDPLLEPEQARHYAKVIATQYDLLGKAADE